MSDCGDRGAGLASVRRGHDRFRERALEPRHAPAAPAAPSANTPSPPTMPVWEPSKPVLSPSKGARRPRTPARWPADPPARFTSKCRKMSQNVALFHTPTRRMARFTSKKPHVFSRFSVIWAHFRSFSRSSTEGGAQTAASGRLAVDTGRARGSIAAMDGGEGRSP